ncbi:unnamed protein product [Caenorhabditis sp. 36 PRJEB53466]|nr:unnamed protein product [Caenorhabditis sp. 36 PRJEB53466]
MGIAPGQIPVLSHSISNSASSTNPPSRPEPVQFLENQAALLDLVDQEVLQGEDERSGFGQNIQNKDRVPGSIDQGKPTYKLISGRFMRIRNRTVLHKALNDVSEMLNNQPISNEMKQEVADKFQKEFGHKLAFPPVKE